MRGEPIICKCDCSETCLKACRFKMAVDIKKKETYYDIRVDGSCWHDDHTDGMYREATMVRV